MALRPEGEGVPGQRHGTSFEGASTVLSVRLDGLDVLVAVHTSGATAAAVAPAIAPGSRSTGRVRSSKPPRELHGTAGAGASCCAGAFAHALTTPSRCRSDTRNGQAPRHRRIACEGEDDLQVPGQRVRRARLGRPRRRPAEQGSVDRRRQRLQADVRADRARQAGGQGPARADEGRQRAVPRDGRGPRGRGHQLAPARVPEAEDPGEADGVPRDHQGGDRPRRHQPARHRLRPRRRRRDPPPARPPVRLRGLAGAVAPGQPRPVRRSRAEPVGPPDRRARARADRLRHRRLLGHRAAHRARRRRSPPRSSRSTAPGSRPARTSPPTGVPKANVVVRRRGHAPGRWPTRSRRADFTRPLGRGEAVPQLAEGAVHDVHAAAGGRPQAAPQRRRR